MTKLEQVNKFVKAVYLKSFNRLLDVTTTKGIEEKEKILIHANLAAQEILAEADWETLRENDATIGTITSISQNSFEVDDEIHHLCTDPDRPLVITQDGSIISKWDIVSGRMFSRQGSLEYTDKVTMTEDRTLRFSRSFTEAELNGTVQADVIKNLEDISDTNTDAIDFLNYNVLVLCTAKT